MHISEGRRRVVIECVKPEIDCGRYPVKRTIGDLVVVEADVYADGHDVVSCVLLYRRDGASGWTEAPMRYLVNDRWRGEFAVTEPGCYRYSLLAWVDHFATWRRDLEKKLEAGQDEAADYLTGAAFLDEAAERAPANDAARLRLWADVLRRNENRSAQRRTALDEDLRLLVERYPDRRFASVYSRELEVVVDRPRARFGAWYEFFPRSASPHSGCHGTFRDCEARLDYIAEMGFDVVYLPPIHPIGRRHRKGKNNAPVAAPGDPGSPWGIGSEEGGHKSVHPQLGTLEDFRRFVAAAANRGMEVALDIAFQASADHPYLKDHPEWFRQRPDGTIQYAENPPKKYQDIYPFDFESANWPELWEELKSILLFWIGQGVRIFRVDNPHTKPFCFWEWLIREIKREHPDVLFLSEAFTRPKVMKQLAKLGFSQSYTYFAWRNTKREIEEYFREIAQGESREYLRPSLWPNTPDILTEYLQLGGRPAFVARLVLAATLGASYGIYGPAFELCENTPLAPGSEEYFHSEKYEIRHWDLDRPGSLKGLIAQVNQVRRENPALQNDWSLRFHYIDNEQLVCYSKNSDDLANLVLVVVNLDPHHTQSGWVELPLRDLGLAPDQPYQAHDLLGGGIYLWQGPRNYVELNPRALPAHIFRIRRRVRTERDFEYYM